MRLSEGMRQRLEGIALCGAAILVLAILEYESFLERRRKGRGR